VQYIDLFADTLRQPLFEARWCANREGLASKSAGSTLSSTLPFHGTAHER
jgi:hypothetical protein